MHINSVITNKNPLDFKPLNEFCDFRSIIFNRIAQCNGRHGPIPMSIVSLQRYHGRIRFVPCPLIVAHVKYTAAQYQHGEQPQNSGNAKNKSIVKI